MVGNGIQIGNEVEIKETLSVAANNRQGPWRGIDDVEFATMTYVDWFNHQRLHGEITNNANYTTPAEYEADYYSQTATALEAVTQ